MIRLRKDYIEKQFHKKRLEYNDYALSSANEDITDLKELNLHKQFSRDELIDTFEAMFDNFDVYSTDKYKLKQIYYNLRKITIKPKDNICDLFISKNIHMYLLHTLSYYSNRELDEMDTSILVIMF
jgi:hypothetical protein